MYTSTSYNMVVQYIIDHGGLIFFCSTITQTPASDFLYNSWAVLVRHSQAQTCPLNRFNKLLWTLMATCLISSSLDIASTWDVPLCQPLYMQYEYHGLTCTFVLLHVPGLFTNNKRCRFVIAWYGLPLAPSCWLFIAYNERDITTNKVQRPPHFSAYD